jgi:hypothetical protein
VLLAGDVIGYGALKDDNASFLVLLPLALIIVCWASSRWNVGALILAATLLVKPLLLPLLLVPILARRWRATAIAAGVTVLGLLLSAPLAGGASGPMEVLKRLSRGSGLTGSSSIYNMSLGGLGEWRHLPEGLVLSARIAIALVAIACIVAVWRLRPPMTLSVIGPLTGVLLGATFLAGPLSEKTYVPLLLPAALTCLLARRHVITGLVIASGLVAAYNSKLFGIGYDGTAWQLRFVTVEVLVFEASVLALRVAVLSVLPDDASRESWGTLVQTLFRQASGVRPGSAPASATS